MTILSIWDFLLANPALLTALAGAVVTFAFSLWQRAIAASPRLAALYSLLCRAFPDASDPALIKADILALITGKAQPTPEPGAKVAARAGKLLPPLLLIALAALLTGCAAFKRDAKTVLDESAIACIYAQPLEAAVPAVAEACQIDAALVPVIDSILAQRKAAAKRALAACAAPASSR